MTRTQKIWDFIFGVALISGVPLILLFGVSSALSALSRSAPNSPFAAWGLLVLGIGALSLSGIWRRKHRHLPESFFLAELLTAILASGLFLLVYVAAGYAAFRAD
jgi:hypothetical protein